MGFTNSKYIGREEEYDGPSYIPPDNVCNCGKLFSNKIAKDRHEQKCTIKADRKAYEKANPYRCFSCRRISPTDDNMHTDDGVDGILYACNQRKCWKGA